MAGPLGVTHLMLFSRSATGNTNLRLALTPRGPTLHFKVERYSLCKDVRKALKHPKGGDKEYKTAPLLVMNNFQTSTPTAEGAAPAVPKHLESLTTSIFQSLFPAISPQATPLSSIRRVLLLNRELPASDADKATPDDGSYVINFRHFAIVTKRTGQSRSIRRLNAADKMLKDRKNRSGMPNLGKLQDVSEYLLDPNAVGGFTSGSESEAETDAEVEVLENTARKVLNKKKLEALRKREEGKAKGGPPVEKRAVKLIELGPRMKLRMTKVEENVCGGKVMWHEYLSRTKEEEKELEERWEERRKVKEKRKRIQKENVAKKRKERGEKVDEDEMMEDGEDDDEWDSEDLENDEDEDEDDNEIEMITDKPLKVPIG